MLSLIDFLLSFVMIAAIGVVLALFPLLNRVGKVDEAALRRSPSRIAATFRAGGASRD